MLLQIIIILLLLAVALIAVNGMRVREIAISYAKNHCAKESVQLLDQSVSSSTVKPSRTASGKLTLLRRYTFDFTSTGEQRYSGQIIMHGMRVAEIQLAPHRMPEQHNTTDSLQ